MTFDSRERQAQVIAEYAKCQLNLLHALARTLNREDLPHHDAERKHVRFFRILAVAKHLGSVTQSRKCLFKQDLHTVETTYAIHCTVQELPVSLDLALTREGRNRKS
ncbi:hypothetical protein PsorP6_008064 [Peronosclerospora sorghi]|uniref:Uncharacterized protein n=1 Tax=Peronosclerospora sorghi TaxID=230839 RepID=A0ACC0WBV9_9STRA|nr:hypothetical protein PsorP6_008064 [Peronosclerospora sorghi]